MKDLKKIFKRIFILVFIVSFLIGATVEAEESSINVIKDQEKEFGISDFIKEADKYSGEFFEDADVSDILDSAIKGDIDNNSIIKKIFKFLGLEVSDTLKSVVCILVIVIIHSMKAL